MHLLIHHQNCIIPPCMYVYTEERAIKTVESEQQCSSLPSPHMACVLQHAIVIKPWGRFDLICFARLALSVCVRRLKRPPAYCLSQCRQQIRR